MIVRIIVSAAIAFISASAAATAASIIVGFSFSNNNSSGIGTVAGIIRGLNDSGANQSATSVKVTSNTAGYGIGEYVDSGNPLSDNLWSVSNGVIDYVNFISFGERNSPPSVTNASLGFVTQSSSGRIDAGLEPVNNSVSFNLQGVDFTTRLAPVPVPATGLLLASGFALVGGLFWRHRALVTSRSAAALPS